MTTKALTIVLVVQPVFNSVAHVHSLRFNPCGRKSLHPGEMEMRSFMLCSQPATLLATSNPIRIFIGQLETTRF